MKATALMKTVFALCESGAIFSRDGENMIYESFKVDRSIPIQSGPWANNPAFLAGAISQTDCYVVAVENDGRHLHEIHGRQSVMTFANALMRENGKGKTSFQIFMEDVVPKYKKNKV